MGWLLFQAIVAFPRSACHQDLMAMKLRSRNPCLLVAITKNRLDCPGNPVKNLSMAYDIPDTWQIIGFAPSCYNNQSVMDPRTDRVFCPTVGLPVCWSINQFYIYLVMLWAWSMSICVLIVSGNGSKDDVHFCQTDGFGPSAQLSSESGSNDPWKIH